MQHLGRIAGFFTTALGVALLLGCAAATSETPTRAAITPPYAPPPRRAEIPPPAPAADALWSVGHWRWDGAQYFWVPGSYLRRPTPTANWIPGYWRQRPGGWQWVDGRWEP